MAYVTRANLEARLGADKVIACYDDGNGQVDEGALAENAETASGLVDTAVIRAYKGTAPFPADLVSKKYPILLREASLLFLMSMTIGRHPEYVRTFGEDRILGYRKEAKELCEDIATGLAPIPEASMTPGVVVTGGIVNDQGPRLMIDTSTGTANGGDF